MPVAEGGKKYKALVYKSSCTQRFPDTDVDGSMARELEPLIGLSSLLSSCAALRSAQLQDYILLETLYHCNPLLE